MTDARTLGDLAPLPIDTSKQYVYKPGTGWVEVTIPSFSLAPAYTSTLQTFAAGGLVSVNHGLGRDPYFYLIELVWVIADAYGSVGDNASIGLSPDIDVTQYGATARYNSTIVSLRVGPGGLTIGNFPSGGNAVVASTTNCRIRFKAW